jgi:hypothetical protein
MRPTVLDKSSSQVAGAIIWTAATRGRAPRAGLM